jgi:hypothetical protein
MTQEPATIRLDPQSCAHVVWWLRPPTITLSYSLRSSLKEFFDPLRTDDSRSDFYTVYRRESREFDQDYIAKYDGDLSTSLLFVSFALVTQY